MAGTSTYTGVTSVAAGRLSVNGALGATPVAPGTAADLLVVSGNLTLDPANGALLTFADMTSGTEQPFVENTTAFAMINHTGTWTGGLFSHNGNALADGSRFNVGSQEWEFKHNASAGGLDFTDDYLPSSSFVTVTAVPEPTTLTLLGIAAAIGLIARRKRE